MEKTLNYEDDPFASLDVEEDVMGEFERWSWNEGKIPWKLWHGGWKLVDIDFEILVTSTSSDADIIAEESGHVDINNEKESDAEEQPTDCISGPAFKYVMNAITVLEEYNLFSNFGADLMKTLKDVNRAFDLNCLSDKIFSKLC